MGRDRVIQDVSISVSSDRHDGRSLPGRRSRLLATEASRLDRVTGDVRGAFVSVFGGPTVELESERAGAVQLRRNTWGTDWFVVAGRTLVAAGRRLTALDIRPGGDRQWTGGKTAQCGPAAAGDTIYAASEDRVTAYDFGGGIGVGPVRLGASGDHTPSRGGPNRASSSTTTPSSSSPKSVKTKPRKRTQLRQLRGCAPMVQQYRPPQSCQIKNGSDTTGPSPAHSRFYPDRQATIDESSRVGRAPRAFRRLTGRALVPRTHQW